MISSKVSKHLPRQNLTCSDHISSNLSNTKHDTPYLYFFSHCKFVSNIFNLGPHNHYYRAVAIRKNRVGQHSVAPDGKYIPTQFSFGFAQATEFLFFLALGPKVVSSKDTHRSLYTLRRHDIFNTIHIYTQCMVPSDHTTILDY